MTPSRRIPPGELQRLTGLQDPETAPCRQDRLLSIIDPDPQAASETLRLWALGTPSARDGKPRAVLPLPPASPGAALSDRLRAPASVRRRVSGRPCRCRTCRRVRGILAPLSGWWRGLDGEQRAAVWVTLLVLLIALAGGIEHRGERGARVQPHWEAQPDAAAWRASQ